MAVCDYLPTWTPGCGTSAGAPVRIPDRAGGYITGIAPSTQRPDTSDPSRRAPDPSSSAGLCAYLPTWTPGCGPGAPSRPTTSAPVDRTAPPPSSPPQPGEGVMCRWFGLACSTGPSIGERIGGQVGDATAAAVKPLLGPLTLLVLLAVVLLVASAGTFRAAGKVFG